MPLNLLLLANAPVCDFNIVNAFGWIQINIFLILAVISIAGLVYAVANFLPADRRTRLKGAANYEIYEAFLGFILIIILLFATTSTCDLGASLTGQSSYTGIFSSDTNYLANLLFLKGLGITTGLYSTSIQFIIVSNIYFYASTNLIGLLKLPGYLPKPTGTGTFKAAFGIQMEASSSIDFLLIEFSELFTRIYSGLLILTFGGLYVLLFALPIIEAGAFTIVIPVAILLRSLPFAGPGLRRTSNEFIALAVAFYIIFPLLISFDSYVASCITPTLGTGVSCTYLTDFNLNQYLQHYTTGALPTQTAAIFQNDQPIALSSGGYAPTSLVSTAGALPTNFWYGSALAGPNWNNFVTELYSAPTVAELYGYSVAEFVFVGIFLVAIDLAMTVGFALGLSKGLNYFNRLFGGGEVLG